MDSRILGLTEWFNNHGDNISKVVDFNQETDTLYPLDFTAANTELSDDLLTDNTRFSEWVANKLSVSGCRYGIGGYNEHRTIYSISSHFGTGTDEPRRLHLGTDIWGPAGTPVYNFYEATVHSFQYNEGNGDYGGTIILKYDFDGLLLHVLYGHLSIASLDGLKVGETLPAGVRFANFGDPTENGNWPPHLHMQLILDLEGRSGDYPGVCKFSERDQYLSNCPDPKMILRHNFLKAQN